MANKTTFQLDTTVAGREILQQMVMPTIKLSGEAIAARARSMAGSISTKPPEFEVFTSVGEIKRGRRAIATVKANAADNRQAYVARTALLKARDAGRLR